MMNIITLIVFYRWTVLTCSRAPRSRTPYTVIYLRFVTVLPNTNCMTFRCCTAVPTRPRGKINTNFGPRACVCFLTTTVPVGMSRGTCRVVKYKSNNRRVEIVRGTTMRTVNIFSHPKSNSIISNPTKRPDKTVFINNNNNNKKYCCWKSIKSRHRNVIKY